jgi:hypothetical protein
MNTQPTPRAVDFYGIDSKNRIQFEYTNRDGEISYGKIDPVRNYDIFDWEENAPEDWEDAEEFIFSEYLKTLKN